jgi:hypothetical protein
MASAVNHTHKFWDAPTIPLSLSSVMIPRIFYFYGSGSSWPWEATKSLQRFVIRLARKIPLLSPIFVLPAMSLVTKYEEHMRFWLRVCEKRSQGRFTWKLNSFLDCYFGPLSLCSSSRKLGALFDPRPWNLYLPCREFHTLRALVPFRLCRLKFKINAKCSNAHLSPLCLVIVIYSHNLNLQFTCLFYGLSYILHSADLC